MFKREVVAAIRELMELHLNASEIAARIKLDPVLVSQIMQFISDQLT